MMMVYDFKFAMDAETKHDPKNGQFTGAGSSHEDLNYKQTGGSFNKRVKKLQNFTLEKNEKSGKIMVRDDRNNQIVGSGFATPEDAVKAYEKEDLRRHGLI